MSTDHDVSRLPERTVPSPRVTTPAGGRRDPLPGTPRWQRRFTALVVAGDLATVAFLTTVAVLVGLTGLEAADRARLGSGLIAAGLLALALPVSRAWDGRVWGPGPRSSSGSGGPWCWPTSRWPSAVWR